MPTAYCRGWVPPILTALDARCVPFPSVDRAYRGSATMRCASATNPYRLCVARARLPFQPATTLPVRTVPVPIVPGLPYGSVSPLATVRSGAEPLLPCRVVQLWGSGWSCRWFVPPVPLACASHRWLQRGCIRTARGYAAMPVGWCVGGTLPSRLPVTLWSFRPVVRSRCGWCVQRRYPQSIGPGGLAVDPSKVSSRRHWSMRWSVRLM